MRNFLLNLKIIFNTSYWFMNDPYNPKMDELINCLIDNNDFTDIRSHTAYLGKCKIWIANRPYACMMPYDNGIKIYGRPSRITIMKGLKKLDKAIKIKDDIEIKIFKEKFGC